jgi:UDP-glucose 4-epimerase
VGAAAPELLDNSVENLVPIVLGKLNKGEAPVIFGTDYPTTDGTCVRDYVDVRDIARAHLAAANATTALPPTMNIGTGRGASVREIIKLVLDATNKSDTAVIENPRRAGDPAFLCADVTLAKSAMGFQSQYSLEASIRSLF